MLLDKVLFFESEVTMNTVVDFIFERNLNETQIVNKINECLNDFQVPNALFLKKDDIRFFQKNMLENNSEEFAINFVENMQMNVAMPIASDLPASDTKDVLACRAKLEEMEAKFEKIDAETSVKNFKYAFIQCANCNSRLNKDYIPDDNICPLCHKDLRKDTTLAKLDKAKGKIKQAQEALSAALEASRKENLGKGPEKWFVRIYVDCVIGESALYRFDYSSVEIADFSDAPVNAEEMENLEATLVDDKQENPIPQNDDFSEETEVTDALGSAEIKESEEAKEIEENVNE